MQELQCTLAELQREEREMAAQRLRGQTAELQDEASHRVHFLTGGTQQNQKAHKNFTLSSNIGNIKVQQYVKPKKVLIINVLFPP